MSERENENEKTEICVVGKTIKSLLNPHVLHRSFCLYFHRRKKLKIKHTYVSSWNHQCDSLLRANSGRTSDGTQPTAVFYETVVELSPEKACLPVESRLHPLQDDAVDGLDESLGRLVNTAVMPF